MVIKRILFILGLFLGIQNVSFAQDGQDISVQVSPGTGNYVVRSASIGWSFAGRLGQKIDELKKSQGRDQIGLFHAVSFVLNNPLHYKGSIKWYENVPVVIFSLNLPEGGVGHSFMPFPQFNQVPDSLYHFSYEDKEFAAPEFKLTQTSTPWMLFDGNKNACVISPASDFIVSKMTGDGVTNISSGLNSEVRQFPKNFTHTSIMVIGKGIAHTWDIWGNALRAIYHRIRPANDGDLVLKKFGYWTDNGADYYYNYDTTLGYAHTLIALRNHYRKEGIPLGYMQLDSWWYEKSIVDPDGKPDADHKNPDLPFGPWNRYGGLMEFKADPFLFPKGLPAFQKSLGLPLVTHNRWVDPASPYQKKYKISWFAAVDPGYWHSVMDYIKAAGVICYEQDWLSYIYNKSPKMISDLKVGNAFADGMADAASADGIHLQYCMAMPRFFLQGVKYNNLTTIRTSDDRFEPKKWMPFIFTSQFGYEMGIWPWCDVFKSPETGNMIVSNLSAGPVGTGDAIGREDKANIMRTCRTDGVLVKPDVPLLPLDRDYIQLAQGSKEPLLAYTYTNHKGLKTGYVFAFQRLTEGPEEIQFTPSEMGYHGQVVVYTPQADKAVKLDADESFHDQLPGSDSYNYYIIAPVTRSGIAFLGDEGKITATGKKRIAGISQNGNLLQIEVVFAKGEHQITLGGYCMREVHADHGQMEQDPKTHLFSLVVPSPKTGNKVLLTLRSR